MSTFIWILIALVAILVVVGALAARNGAANKRRHADYREAADLRDEARASETAIKRHQAEADEVEARARAARAEADRKEAESRKLETDYEEHRSTLTEHIEQRDQALRRADEIDPDVDTEH